MKPMRTGAAAGTSSRMTWTNSFVSLIACAACLPCAARSANSGRGTSESRSHWLREREVGDRDQVLPASLPPRGLSRVQAAAYVGVSPVLFDELVKDGRMPK